jgi:putative transposase
MSCTLYASLVLRNVAKKYQKEVADKLREALEDQQKMQDLSLELEKRGYSKASDTIERFKLDLFNHRVFPGITGRRSGLPMDWKGSIKN